MMKVTLNLVNVWRRVTNIGGIRFFLKVVWMLWGAINLDLQH